MMECVACMRCSNIACVVSASISLIALGLPQYKDERISSPSLLESTFEKKSCGSDNIDKWVLINPDLSWQHLHNILKWYGMRLLHIPEIHRYHHRLTDQSPCLQSLKRHSPAVLGKYYSIENPPCLSLILGTNLAPNTFFIWLSQRDGVINTNSSCLTSPCKPYLEIQSLAWSLINTSEQPFSFQTIFDDSLDQISTLILADIYV